jgi:predicted HTH transcriptional regulator
MSDENGNSMKVAKFLGKDKMELIENYEFGYCSLIKATKSILDRLEIENTKRVKSCSQGLIETTLVDKIALKEAVINAVVHNDYSREIPPVVMIYSDRIEITSMGGLPEHISEDDFFSGVSHPVNKEIARIFQDLGLVQNIGNGIKKITDIYGREAYKFYRDHIIVSLPFNIKK